jgi:hypothetical protein
VRDARGRRVGRCESYEEALSLALEESARTGGPCRVHCDPTLVTAKVYGTQPIPGQADPDTTPPSVPANLAVIVTAQPAAVLTWSASTDNVGVVGYNVTRDGTPLGTTSNLTFTDLTVVVGTTHQYQVSAFDAAGNTSALSTAVPGVIGNQATAWVSEPGIDFTRGVVEAIDPIAIGLVADPDDPIYLVSLGILSGVRDPAISWDDEARVFRNSGAGTAGDPSDDWYELLDAVVGTPPPGESDGQFSFAEIPEIFFLRGFAETEQMGIFQLDTDNRWTPGDLRRLAGWASVVQPALVVESGSMTDVTYNAVTGELTYNGGGSGNQEAVCHFRATIEGATLDSPSFRVRVRQPTVLWGFGAHDYVAKAGWTNTPIRSSASFNSMQGGGLNTTVTADPATDLFTASSAEICAGITPFVLQGGSAVAPAPLALATTYWSIPVTSGTFRVATSLANALAGTFVNLTTAGSGLTANITGDNGLRGVATDADPDVVLCLGGEYNAQLGHNFFIGSEKPFIYLFGDPTDRPLWRNDATFSWDTLEQGGDSLMYLKGVELMNFAVNVGPSQPEAQWTSRYYVSKVYVHDTHGSYDNFAGSNQEFDGGGTNPPSVILGAKQYWYWCNEYFNAGSDDLHHVHYFHGRPGGVAHFNNCLFRGANNCQQIKSTLPYLTVRNTFMSAVQHPTGGIVPASSEVESLEDMTIGPRANNLIDPINVATIVLYNNDMTGAYQTGVASAFNGTQSGMYFPRARRECHGSDCPAYPLLRKPPTATTAAEDYEAGVTDVLLNGYFTNDPRFTWLGAFLTDGGPATFKNPAFWNAVRAARPTYDDANQAQNSPYTFKHYISYNTFRWLTGGTGTSQYAAPVRNEGTYPRRPISQGSGPSNFERAEPEWTERAVDFFANNRYIGWLPDVTEADLFNYRSSEAVNTIEAGSQWIWNTSEARQADYTRTGALRFMYPIYFRLGGELVGAGTFTPITLPGYFKR